MMDWNAYIAAIATMAATTAPPVGWLLKRMSELAKAVQNCETARAAEREEFQEKLNDLRDVIEEFRSGQREDTSIAEWTIINGRYRAPNRKMALFLGSQSIAAENFEGKTPEEVWGNAVAQVLKDLDTRARRMSGSLVTSRVTLETGTAVVIGKELVTIEKDGQYSAVLKGVLLPDYS